MSWISLYFKELYLSKTKILLNIIFLVFIAVFLYVTTERYSSMFLTLSIPLVLFHGVYMFFAMIDLLRLEWKHATSHFWLNIPKSGWYLLSAKFIAAASQMIISLTGTLVIIYIILQKVSSQVEVEPIPQLFLELFHSFWWVLIGGIMIASMKGGAIAAFLYVMSKAVAKWGFLLGIAIVLGASWLWDLIYHTSFFQWLTNWGVLLREDKIAHSLVPYIEGVTEEPITDVVTDGAVIYLGTTIAEILMIIVILLVTAWLLDHKVES